MSGSTIFLLTASVIANDGRVLRQARQLTAAGHRVIAIGAAAGNDRALGAETAAVQLTIPHATWSASERVRAAAALSMARAPLPAAAVLALARQLPGVAALGQRLREATAGTRAGNRMTIANDWTALPAAIAACEELDIPFHYDTHELATEEHAHSRRWRLLFAPLIRAVERLGMAQARSVSCVSPGIAAALSELYGLGEAPSVVANLPEGAPLPPAPPGRPIDVLYHGIFTPNRGLEPLVAGVAHWPDGYRLVLRGRSNAPAFARVMDGAVTAGVRAGRIVVEPMLPAEHVIPRANAAAIGVFLPDIGLRQNRHALPNKLFEYLWAGLLPVVPAGTDMADLVARHGAGATVGPGGAASIADLLAGLTPERIMAEKHAAHRAALAIHARAHEHSIVTALARPLQRRA